MAKMLKKDKPQAPQPLVVDQNNRTPLYHQLFLILRSKIMDGDYSTTTYLPGENELARMYGVSRITAVRALKDLAAEGLVSRERGRGTRVRLVESAVIARGPAESSGRSSRRAKQGGGSGKIELVGMESVAPPVEVARILALGNKATVNRIIRIDRFEEGAYRYVTSYVSLDISSRWKRSDLSRFNIAHLFERSGVKSGRIDERVTATLADHDAAARLGVTVGSPLIKIMRTVYDLNRRAIEYSIGYYPPERYEYVVSVTRQGRLLSPLRLLNS